jgi:hypothetical protein
MIDDYRALQGGAKTTGQSLFGMASAQESALGAISLTSACDSQQLEVAREMVLRDRLDSPHSPVCPFGPRSTFRTLSLCLQYLCEGGAQLAHWVNRMGLYSGHLRLSVPLNNIALVGEHADAAWKSVKRRRPLARLSMLGVLISPPNAPVSEKPRSSATMTRKFGRVMLVLTFRIDEAM